MSASILLGLLLVALVLAGGYFLRARPVVAVIFVALCAVPWILGAPGTALVLGTLALSILLAQPLYVVLGTLIMYSIMIALAATSVWLGRNQSLYDFWFYITNFARYPMEIYHGPIGNYLRWTLTFILPVLVVVNVPARLLAKPFHAEYSYLALFAIVATVASLVASRWLFQRALVSYRSASS